MQRRAAGYELEPSLHGYRERSHEFPAFTKRCLLNAASLGEAAHPRERESLP